jgi:hypothetical protein
MAMMTPHPDKPNGKSHRPEAHAAAADAMAQAAAPSGPGWWARAVGRVSPTWAALVLIVAIAYTGWTIRSALAAKDRRDDRQDTTLKALVEIGRWQSQAIWRTSQGQPVEGPPPALPGVE